MSKLRYNGLVATLASPGLTNSATSINFAAALTHSGGTAVPTITGSELAGRLDRTFRGAT